MPKTSIDLAGRRFSSLTAESLVDQPGKAVWVCTCDCGNVTKVRACNLQSGAVKSCGCLRIKLPQELHTTHGKRYTRIYYIWAGIKARTGNPKNRLFKWYGGRGISMFPEWRDSFEAFLAAVGEPPFPGATIDRVDNDKGYEPGNVRWATMKQQNNNKSSNTVLEALGRSMSIAQWADETGIPAPTIAARVNRLGWDAEAAVTKPVRARAASEFGVSFETVH